MPRSSWCLIDLYLLQQLMCCLALVLILFSVYLLSTLLLTFSAVFGLTHSCNPRVTDLSDSTRSPSTRISFLLRGLQLLWLYYVSVDELSTQNETLQLFTVTKTPTGNSRIAVRHCDQALVMNGILFCFTSTVTRCGGSNAIIIFQPVFQKSTICLLLAGGLN